MEYNSVTSLNQVNSSKRHLNKKSDLASLPTIDPALISIGSAASRLIDEMEDTFNQITNADSNDGIEVTVARRATAVGNGDLAAGVTYGIRKCVLN
jgi:hypothetical protein